MNRDAARTRIALVAPAADPDDPLDPGACLAAALGAAAEVIVLREGSAAAAEVAGLPGVQLVACVGAPGDTLGLAVARRAPAVLVLAGADVLSGQLADAEARRALPAFAAGLAAEAGAQPSAPVLHVVRRCLARQGVGLGALVARARGAVLHDPALAERLPRPPGGVHLAPRALDAGTLGRLAATQEGAGGGDPLPRIVVAGAPEAARAGFAVLRAATRAPAPVQLDFCGGAAVPGWPLYGAAAALGLGGRVRWFGAGGRGALARRIAGAGAVIALDEEAAAAGAALMGRGFGLPALAAGGVAALPHGAAVLGPEALDALFAGIAPERRPPRPDAAVLAAHAPGRAAAAILAALGRRA